MRPKRVFGNKGAQHERAPAAGPLDAFAWRTSLGFEFSERIAVLSAGSPAGQAIDTAAAGILAHHIIAGRRGIVLCAASDSVGVTFTGVNLAVALSRAGVSVLFVDANVRNPGLHRYIRPPQPVRGLGDFLQDDDLRFGDIIQHQALTGLSLVYAGTNAEMRLDGVATERFRSFADACLREYEYTIFDSPCASRSQDAREIATMVGYALLVARRGYSFAQDIAFLREQLELDGVQIVGSILNGA